MYNFRTISPSIIIQETYDLVKHERHVYREGYDWLYSFLQGRPMEICMDDSGAERLNEHYKYALTKINESRSIFDSYKYVMWFGHKTKEYYASPCAVEWKPASDAVFLMRFASHVIGHSYIYNELGLTFVFLAVMRLLASLLGMLSFFILGQRLSGSTTIGWITLLLVMSLMPTVTPLMCVALTMLLGLTIVNPFWASWKNKWAKSACELVLFVLFIANSALYLFIDPPQHRQNVILIIGFGLVAAIVGRNVRVFLRTAVAGLGIIILFSSFYSEGTRLFSPSGVLNHAANQAGVHLALFHGIGERPNYFGYIPTDYGGYIYNQRDALLNRFSPHLIAHQTLPVLGKEYLIDLYSSHQLDELKTIVRRIYVLLCWHWVIPHQALFPEDAHLKRSYYSIALWTIFILSIVALFRKSFWLLYAPAFAVLWWEAAGTYVLLTYWHHYDTYARYGMLLIYSLSPAILCLFVRFRNDLLPCLKLPRSKFRLIASVILLLSILSLLPTLRRELAKETHALQLAQTLLWTSRFDIDAGNPQIAVDHINAIKKIGGDPLGSVDMHAAWFFFHMYMWRYTYQWGPGFLDIPDTPENRAIIDQRARLGKQLYQNYYRSALYEAPNNPYYPSYAYILGIPEWPEIFIKYLPLFPHSPFALHMATKLLEGEHLANKSDREQLIRFLDASTSSFLLKTAENRPGFKAIPKIIDLDAKAGATEKILPEGILLFIPKGSTIRFEPFSTFHSSEIKLSFYTAVKSGAVDAYLEGPGNALLSLPMLLNPGSAFNHRLLQCSGTESLRHAHLALTATSDKGATVLVRDYYPLIERFRIKPYTFTLNK